MAASSDFALPRFTRVAALAGSLMALGCLFPLFHVLPLLPQTGSDPGRLPAAFDPRAAAEKIWKHELSAAGHATELSLVVAALRTSAEVAKARFAKSAGVGAAYYFVRGRGKIVSRERNYLRVAVDNAPNDVVVLRIGSVFGNVVRDGCGLLDVNSFPGLQEFNALAAELNALVEKNVLPALREKAGVGAVVEFIGCAEAPGETADPGEPLLAIVPVRGEVR